MESRLHLEMVAQPDDVTCGPTCLHAIYLFHGDEMSLDRVIHEVPRLDGGGTLAVLLACHALRRGYDARIYTYNLQMFDPTWFAEGAVVDLRAALEAQAAAKDDAKLRAATKAYLDYLDLGGKVVFRDLTGGLIRGYLKRNVPILTGLSSTYLYAEPREYGPGDAPDPVRGMPSGHFVVLCGYDPDGRRVLVADPYGRHGLSQDRMYQVGIDRVICAILLGILTYDANLLILTRRDGARA